MSTEDRGDEPVESTFADVLNSVTLNSGRGWRAKAAQDSRGAESNPTHEAQQPQPVEQHGEPDESAAIVRAYAWTGGRTQSEVSLQIETLVSTSEFGATNQQPMQAEYRAIADLCVQPR